MRDFRRCLRDFLDLRLWERRRFPPKTGLLRINFPVLVSSYDVFEPDPGPGPPSASKRSIYCCVNLFSFAICSGVLLNIDVNLLNIDGVDGVDELDIFSIISADLLPPPRLSRAALLSALLHASAASTTT